MLIVKISPFHASRFSCSVEELKSHLESLSFRRSKMKPFLTISLKFFDSIHRLVVRNTVSCDSD